MKKQIVISIIVFFYATVAWTEHCLPNGITFSTQSDIDSFQTDYPGCTVIDGDVNIKGRGIINLNSLSVLDSIMGDLIIEDNPALQSLTGLHNITYLGANVEIIKNYVLASLTGLDKLKSIEQDLLIENNANLADLTALGSLTSVGGDLEIIQNNSLASLTGLDNINTIGGELILEDNNTLSHCEVEGICNYLEGGGAAGIDNNRTGCDSRAEVLDACATGIISVVPDYFLSKYKISILLSPVTTNRIIVQSSLGGQWDVRIYNSLGQLCKKFDFKGKKSELDISALTEGIYFIKVNIDGLYSMQKIIKK